MSNISQMAAEDCSCQPSIDQQHAIEKAIDKKEATPAMEGALATLAVRSPWCSRQAALQRLRFNAYTFDDARDQGGNLEEMADVPVCPLERYQLKLAQGIALMRFSPKKALAQLRLVVGARALKGGERLVLEASALAFAMASAINDVDAMTKHRSICTSALLESTSTSECVLVARTLRRVLDMPLLGREHGASTHELLEFAVRTGLERRRYSMDERKYLMQTFMDIRRAPARALPQTDIATAEQKQPSPATRRERPSRGMKAPTIPEGMRHKEDDPSPSIPMVLMFLSTVVGLIVWHRHERKKFQNIIDSYQRDVRSALARTSTLALHNVADLVLNDSYAREVPIPPSDQSALMTQFAIFTKASAIATTHEVQVLENEIYLLSTYCDLVHAFSPAAAIFHVRWSDSITLDELLIPSRLLMSYAEDAVTWALSAPDQHVSVEVLVTGTTDDAKLSMTIGVATNNPESRIDTMNPHSIHVSNRQRIRSIKQAMNMETVLEDLVFANSHTYTVTMLLPPLKRGVTSKRETATA
jgi:hypothetical protein